MTSRVVRGAAALLLAVACVRHGTSLTLTGATWYHPRPVRDFAIDLDYRATDPTADAAILLRVDSARAGSGYEVSLRAQPPGGPYERYQRATGAITGVMAPSHVAANPAGAWNHVRVAVAGQRYRVWVNGELVTDFFGARGREGLVGLRAPGGASVAFRDVRVTSIAPGPERLGDALAAPAGAKPIRVLVVTATHGFRHTEAIDASREVLAELGRTTEFRFDFSDTAGAINAANLARYDVLFLDNATLRGAPADTTAAAVAATRAQRVKDPLTPEQVAALDAFVRSGKGVALAHSGLDAMYGVPSYREMVGGGLFEMHPWIEPVRVVVEDRASAATRHLGDAVWIRDEIYVLDHSPRATSHVLLSLDKASAGAPNVNGDRPVQPSPGVARADHPTSWVRRHGEGRVFATLLGHFGDVWHRPDFLQHLLQGLRIAAGTVPADFTPGGAATTGTRH